MDYKLAGDACPMWNIQISGLGFILRKPTCFFHLTMSFGWTTLCSDQLLPTVLPPMALNHRIWFHRETGSFTVTQEALMEKLRFGPLYWVTVLSSPYLFYSTFHSLWKISSLKLQVYNLHAEVSLRRFHRRVRNKVVLFHFNCS